MNIFFFNYLNFIEIGQIFFTIIYQQLVFKSKINQYNDQMEIKKIQTAYIKFLEDRQNFNSIFKSKKLKRQIIQYSQRKQYDHKQKKQSLNSLNSLNSFNLKGTRFSYNEKRGSSAYQKQKSIYSAKSIKAKGQQDFQVINTPTVYAKFKKDQFSKTIETAQYDEQINSARQNRKQKITLSPPKTQKTKTQKKIQQFFTNNFVNIQKFSILGIEQEALKEKTNIQLQQSASKSKKINRIPSGESIQKWPIKRKRYHKFQDLMKAKGIIINKENCDIVKGSQITCKNRKLYQRKFAGKNPQKRVEVKQIKSNEYSKLLPPQTSQLCGWKTQQCEYEEEYQFL